MKLTLGEVLRFDILKEARVLTRNYDSGCEVKGISIMEAPDILDWVEGNEIILTSLYAVTGDPQKLKDLVSSFHAKKICALIVKTKRFYARVPKIILEKAEELGFAVIEIPPSLRFTDIMYPVMAAVFDNQVIKLSYFKETQNLLTGLALKNAGIKGIADAFKNIVGNPVIIYDKDYKLQYTTDPKDTSPVTKRIELGRKEAEAMFSADAMLSENTPGSEILPGKATDTIPQRQAELLPEITQAPVEYIMPITVLDFPAGYLGVQERGHPLSELDFIAMENAMTILSLELLKDFAVHQVEHNYKMELIEDILSGKNRSTLAERAKNINWNLNKRYAVACLQFSLSEDTSSTLYDQINLGSTVNAINTAVKSAMHRYGIAGISESRKNQSILFIEQPASSPSFKERMEHFAADLLKELTLLPGIRSVTMGFSSQWSDIHDVPATYKNALYATKIGRILYGENSFCDFENLGLFKLLCMAESKEELTAFIPHSLKSLMEYDAKNHTELVRTLSSFFENSRNANKAAQALFIHYKTMTYRMNKIQEVTGLNYRNHNEMLEAEVGLEILKIMEETAAG